MKICEQNGISYELDQINHTAKIIKSLNSEGDLFIPQSINYESQEYIIISINEDSFQENSRITSISFHDNSFIKIIGRNAFESTIIETISIPDSVTQIEEYSFIWCKSLKTINISENSNLNSIGPRSFVDTPIETIFFPQKLENLEKGWCDRMSSLHSIIVSPQNKKFEFINGRYLLDTSKNIFYFASRIIDSIFIQSKIKEIEPFAFDNCIHLHSVIFDENSQLTTIGNDAFRNCFSLKKIKIPSNVNSIESEAFYNCSNIKTIIFDENSNLKKIGKNCFHGCSFETFSIPKNVTSIESSTFSYCSQLKYLVISDNSMMKSISPNTFVCSGIEKIFIPSFITYFCSSAFCECKKLKFIEFLGEELYFDNKIFRGCHHLSVISFPNCNKVVIGSKSFYKIGNKCTIFTKNFAKIELNK